MTRYLVTFVIAGLTLTLLTGAANYLVDPFGMLNSPVELKKTQAYSRGRILKAHLPHQLEIDTLLVGNSRVELGLSPNHPALDHSHTYNLGLPGADISMQSYYAYNVIKGQPVKALIMSVDFVDFLFTEGKDYRHSPDTYKKRLKFILNKGENQGYSWQKTKDLSAALLSLDALTASATTLLTQNSRLSYMQKDGKMNEDEFFSIVENEGIGILFEQKEQNLRNKFTQKEWLISNPGTDSSTHFENFKSLISAAIEQQIKVSLFISPLHKNYIAILEETDKLGLFREWKRLLVEHLDGIGFYPSGQLWDFSLASDYTNETVPDRDKKGVYMSWYWEPAHYRSELGDKILNTLLLADQSWGKALKP